MVAHNHLIATAEERPGARSPEGNKRPPQPERILSAVRARRENSTPSVRHIDCRRPFIPERFTPLFHTPCYAELTPQQRLRYNQLSGLQVNERLMLFEHGFAERVLSRLLDHPRIKARPALVECLQLSLADEQRHHAMFRRLNSACMPEAYAGGRWCFDRLSRWEELVLKLMTWRPDRLPFLIWLVLLLEEHSTALSRAMVREQETDLGPLEPNFVNVHRAHLRDEVQHVHVDIAVIEALFDQRRSGWQRVDAWLFRRFVGELVASKRAGIRVIERLVREFPDLKEHAPTLIRTSRKLPRDTGLVTALLNPHDMPRAHALMERFPEFDLHHLAARHAH